MKPYPQREGEPLTKRCPICHEDRWIAEFRLLVPTKRMKGLHRATYCQDCEQAYDKLRRRDPNAKIADVVIS